MPATVWKGFISFGLVSFPVRLFSAARAETVHFHMLHKKDLSRVKEVWYCADENKPINRTDIVKGYETNKGEYVVVDDEELKKIAPVLRRCCPRRCQITGHPRRSRTLCRCSFIS